MLLESIKFLTKDTLLYGLSGAASRFLAIFTVPIITRVLSQEEYGTIDAVNVFIPIFTGLIVLGQDSAIARFFYDKDGEFEHRRKIASIGLTIQLLLLIIIATLLYPFIEYIGEFLYADKRGAIKYWIVGLLSVPGSVFVLFSINIFKWTFKRTKYLVVSLGASILQVLLVLYLVVYLKQGVMGAILPRVIAFNLFGIAGLFLCRKYLKLGGVFQDTKTVKSMLYYGLPFGAVAFISTVIPSVDRFFLLRYADLAQIGVYSIGLKVASILGLITSGFTIAFSPFAFSVWEKEGAEENFAKIFKLYIILLAFLIVGVAAFGEFIINIIAVEAYHKAIIVIPPLLIANLFQGLMSFTVLGISWSKKTIYMLLVYGLSTVVLFISNFILVPHFSTLGASISLILGNIIMNLTAYLISNKFYNIPIQFKGFLWVLFLTGVTFSFVYLDYFFDNEWITILKLFSVFAFPVFCYLLVLDANEKQKTLAALHKIVTR